MTAMILQLLQLDIANLDTALCWNLDREDLLDFYLKSGTENNGRLHVFIHRVFVQIVEENCLNMNEAI